MKVNTRPERLPRGKARLGCCEGENVRYRKDRFGGEEDHLWKRRLSMRSNVNIAEVVTEWILR